MGRALTFLSRSRERDRSIDRSILTNMRIDTKDMRLLTASREYATKRNETKRDRYYEGYSRIIERDRYRNRGGVKEGSYDLESIKKMDRPNR